MNRYLERRARAKAANLFGTVSEKHTMVQLKANVIPGSGCLLTAKSDGFDEVFQYENKSTCCKSFSITKKILDKIKKEAREVGREPVVCLSFVTGSGQSVRDGDFVIVSRDLFMEMKESYKRKY